MGGRYRRGRGLKHSARISAQIFGKIFAVEVSAVNININERGKIMKKILFTLMIVAMLACPAMAQRYRQHQVTIVDEFGDPVTNIDIITIIDTGTSNNSTIYPTRAGGTMTNPITTATTGSTFVQSLGLVSWFQRAPTYKITITESGASQSLTLDNRNETDTRFPFYANYIGAATTLTVLDDSTLNIGTSADFVHDWDNNNTRYVIYPSGDGGRLDFGNATVHTDVYFHAGDITTDYVLFDEGSLNVQFIDIDLLIDDEAKILIGDSSDVTIEYDEGNNDLDILSTSALDEIAFGATGDGYDLKWWSTTAGDYALFDYSGDALLLEDLTLAIGDGELLLFGDTIGTGTMSLSVATAKLSLLQVAADTGTFDIGVAGTDVPTTWHGETSGAEVIFTGDTVIVDGIDMTFNDGDFLKFGDDFDFTITSASTKNLTIAPLAASDDYIVSLGSDQSGVHIKAFGGTTGEYMYWDATNDSLTVVGDLALFTMTGTTKPFFVNVTGTVAGIAAEIQTTDGGITLDANGGSNGDLLLEAADDASLTAAGDFTLAVTGSTVLDDILFDRVVVTPTEGTTITLDAVNSGAVVMNVASAGATTFTLPTAAAGLQYTFVDNSLTGGDDLTITASSGDTINSGTAAGSIGNTADVFNQTITLLALDATNWITIASSGTWSQS